jgi:hypothetical protein
MEGYGAAFPKRQRREKTDVGEVSECGNSNKVERRKVARFGAEAPEICSIWQSCSHTCSYTLQAHSAIRRSLWSSASQTLSSSNTCAPSNHRSRIQYFCETSSSAASPPPHKRIAAAEPAAAAERAS